MCFSHIHLIVCILPCPFLPTQICEIKEKSLIMKFYSQYVFAPIVFLWWITILSATTFLEKTPTLYLSRKQLPGALQLVIRFCTQLFSSCWVVVWLEVLEVLYMWVHMCNCVVQYNIPPKPLKLILATLQEFSSFGKRICHIHFLQHLFNSHFVVGIVEG